MDIGHDWQPFVEAAGHALHAASEIAFGHDWQPAFTAPAASGQDWQLVPACAAEGHVARPAPVPAGQVFPAGQPAAFGQLPHAELVATAPGQAAHAVLRATVETPGSSADLAAAAAFAAGTAWSRRASAKPFLTKPSTAAA